MEREGCRRRDAADTLCPSLQHSFLPGLCSPATARLSPPETQTLPEQPEGLSCSLLPGCGSRARDAGGSP